MYMSVIIRPPVCPRILREEDVEEDPLDSGATGGLVY